MAPMPDKDPLEYAAQYAQRTFASSPVVVLGSGASYPHGVPGMGELRDHLIQTVTTADAAEGAAWDAVRKSMDEGQHLEQAMEGKLLPPSLVEKLVLSTWKCVNAKDLRVYFKVLGLQESLPAGLLFDRLFRSTSKTIDVVTTNYDRLVEYACASVGLIHVDGFSPGYFGSREDWDTLRIYRGSQQARTVHIWKVHGSLTWFERPDGSIVSVPFVEDPPEGLRPLVVTPGTSKYERMQHEPFRSAMQSADQAFKRAEGFLCVGFGFRDPQLEPKLVEQCRRKNVPITVLARTLTEEAKTFLRNKAGKYYLALERSGDNTKAYTADYPDGFELPGTSFWSLDGYLNLVTSA